MSRISELCLGGSHAIGHDCCEGTYIAGSGCRPPGGACQRSKGEYKNISQKLQSERCRQGDTDPEMRCIAGRGGSSGASDKRNRPTFHPVSPQFSRKPGIPNRLRGMKHENSYFLTEAASHVKYAPIHCPQPVRNLSATSWSDSVVLLCVRRT